jgi:hypothetical protein
MSVLESIVTTVALLAPRLLIYGREGVGKTTMAATTPGPIIVDLEGGLGRNVCPHFPQPSCYQEVVTALKALLSDPHDFQTVVLDSLDWMERLIWEELCKAYGVSSIEKVDGGYGKGYVHALTYWREIIDLLTKLRSRRNMMVIMLAHAKVERFEDPEAPAYDRYSPRLNKHASALLSEWSDAVLFATTKFVTRTETGAFNRTRTQAAPVGKDGGERILRCIGGPACIAKNRYDLPAELPLEWIALAEGLFNQANTNINQSQIEGDMSNG